MTTIGQISSVYVPSTLLLDRDIDGRFGFRVIQPRIYVAFSYLWRNTNYGYPQQHGAGFGAEKLPDLDQPFSVYGSYYYYPNISAPFTEPSTGSSFDFSYNVQKFEAGLTFRILPLARRRGFSST